ncbi:hypothetical protein GCM10017667_04180 [Streptomyces filamentosus]|uniref:Uncharacterized protein n=1 Tax=Streptomyces filamentosus TaxID=67294 RepID=A0A919BCN8_STRFL|nr:hypothetical protein GCM10017667_04180 [Streptomyces filamentosus]
MRRRWITDTVALLRQVAGQSATAPRADGPFREGPVRLRGGRPGGRGAVRVGVPRGRRLCSGPEAARGGPEWPGVARGWRAGVRRECRIAPIPGDVRASGRAGIIRFGAVRAGGAAGGRVPGAGGGPFPYARERPDFRVVPRAARP